jgi:hypothetical protein
MIMFVFYFCSILDYMYLFPTMNYTRSCCLACKYCALVYTYTCTHKTKRNEIYDEFWISRTPGYLEVFLRSLQLRDRGILLYMCRMLIIKQLHIYWNVVVDFRRQLLNHPSLFCILSKDIISTASYINFIKVTDVFL